MSQSGRQRTTHLHIESDLRQRIGRGEWTTGSLLPGRRELAEQYGVALNTVQRAVTTLIEAGLLTTQGGRGTFVAGQALPAVTQSHAPAAQATQHQIGVVVPFGRLDDPPNAPPENPPWNEMILHGVEAEAGRLGLTTRSYPMFGNSGHFRGVLAATTAALADGVDLLVWVNLHNNNLTFAPEVFGALRTLPVPVIYVSVAPVPHHIPQVLYDQTMAGREVGDHLLARGYRTIIGLRLFESAWLDARLRGLRSLVQAPMSGATYHELSAAPVPYYDFGRLSANRQLVALHHLLAQIEHLLTPAELDKGVAIVAPRDHVAEQVHAWLEQRSPQLRKAVGLVGYDDGPQARSMHLTSMRPPCDELGRHAARLAMRVLQGEAATLELRLSGTLVARGSTRRAIATADVSDSPALPITA